MSYDISTHVVFKDNSYIDEFISSNLIDIYLYWDFRSDFEKRIDLIKRNKRLIGRSQAQVKGLELIPDEIPSALCWVSKNDRGGISRLELKIIGESSWDGFTKLIRRSSLHGAVVYFGDEHMDVELYYDGLPVAQTGGVLYDPAGFLDGNDTNILVDKSVLRYCYTDFLTDREMEYVAYSINKNKCTGSRIWFEESWSGTITNAIYDSQSDYEFLFDYVVMEHDTFEKKYGEDTHCECIQEKLLDALFWMRYTPIIEKIVVGKIL
ncbi:MULTISPECIES: hypothetical protein [unclassified Pseudodesulfovibrio]|uniref:hypothetical protein n=1 Tax=unclassified Pseudodesulfovibrio TaxID=2661612 RepID=UPI000FEBDBA9|nr:MULTISPECIES: hypothetical protein [unclassified Pseudodesulfovibrio]MCJ2163542.1 hypothetical protein [Pseudodesulfovibrio sp. S3-i]RWU06778.1 hypothetical protein DWB63_03165 [Pseudodesulfovibrio sp. S3]